MSDAWVFITIIKTKPLPTKVNWVTKTRPLLRKVLPMVKAIDLYAAVPETPPDVISKAYRKLGETYLKLNAYYKGADAFSMALKFSEGNQDTDLKFLLGETYEKSRQLERAQRVYQDIVDSGDPFWARLAKERLRGISIHTKLKTKETATGG